MRDSEAGFEYDERGRRLVAELLGRGADQVGDLFLVQLLVLHQAARQGIELVLVLLQQGAGTLGRLVQNSGDLLVDDLQCVLAE